MQIHRTIIIMNKISFLTLLVIYIKYCESSPVFSTPVYKTPIEFNSTEFNVTSHLQIGFVQKICNKRESMCKSNDTKVCAVRKINKTYEFKDFDNPCYLFLSNMCDYSDNEFYIVESSRCNAAVTRRHYVDSGVDIGTAPARDNTTGAGNTTAPALRAFNISMYDVYYCNQGHPCAPLSCPNVYKPVCMNVNHKVATNPKFYTFVNHCEMDRFFCKHYKDFDVPQGFSGPHIVMSFLEWTRCGAQRYLKFIYTAQAASSMGHYGWLDDDVRYSKILEPWQRKPGFG